MSFTPAKRFRRLSLLERALRLSGVVMLVSLPACGVLNPTLEGTAGVNAVSTVNTLPGNVVISFLNQTAFPARANVTVVEEGNIVNLNQLQTGSASYVTAAYHCGLSQIVVTSADVSFASNVFTMVTDEGDRSTLQGGINFGCGSVVIIILEGVVDNFILTTQVF